MVGRAVVVTMSEEYVTEAAKEFPHMRSQGDETGGEFHYSFPLHPTHYDEWMAEMFKMEEVFMFSVVMTDVNDILRNVHSTLGEED